jgi:hypothetical protein
MPDPIELARAAEAVRDGAIVLAGAATTKAAFATLFGPSVREVADFLARLTNRRLERIERTVNIAAWKLRSDTADAAGVIDERVWDRVFFASDSDDPWVIEYLAGVLASAHSQEATTDYGARIAGRISQLTALQLRAHYAWYSILRRELTADAQVNLLDRAGMAEMRVFVPRRVSESALGLAPAGAEEQLTHALFGLRQDHMLGLHQMGSAEALAKAGYDVDEEGMIISPYNVGIELYMWAHGAGHMGNGAYFDGALDFRLSEVDVVFPKGARRVVRTDG